MYTLETTRRAHVVVPPGTTCPKRSIDVIPYPTLGAITGEKRGEEDYVLNITVHSYTGTTHTEHAGVFLSSTSANKHRIVHTQVDCFQHVAL